MASEAATGTDGQSRYYREPQHQDLADPQGYLDRLAGGVHDKLCDESYLHAAANLP